MQWSSRLPVSLLLLSAAACSRAPSADQRYTSAWEASRRGHPQLATQLIDTAIAEGNVPDRVRLLQAEILVTSGEFSKANAILSSITSSLTPELRRRLLVDRAEILIKTRHAEEGLALLDEVDRTFGDATEDPVFRGMFLRSRLLLNGDNYTAGQALLRTAAARAAKAGDSFNQAAALVNLSYATIRRNRFDESLEYSLAALEAAKKADANRLVGLANNNSGIAYTVLGYLEQAETHLVDATRQLREAGDPRNLADALGELGNLHLRTGRPNQAETEFQEAFKICTSSHMPSEAGRWASQLAVALIRQQKWDAAASWNEKAAGLSQDDPELADQRTLIKLNDAAITTGLGNANQAAAMYRQLLAVSKDNAYLAWNAHVQLASLLARSEHFKEAYTEYDLGLGVIDKVRSGILLRDSRMRYQELKMEFFREYVDLLATKNQAIPALQVSEYGRARVLAENLGLQPKGTREVSVNVLQRYSKRTGATLLSYWLAPQRSYVWVITPDRIRMKELPGENEIGSLIQSYRKAIEEDLRDPVEAQLPQGRRLREMLLGPIEAELTGARRIIVVPDGPLHTLNLETLPSAQPGRYWIEDVEISVAPSLSVLADATQPPPSKPSLLLIGAPISPNRDYPPLPAAQTEIDSIEKHFDAGQKLVHTGAAATPQSFLTAQPERFSMIHFAAHADARPESPLDSAVILADEPSGYKLYAHDIAGLKLSANLVTISACRSAGVRSYKGEGLVGFAWVFLQSGARSVIAGLWDVGDVSSSQLMTTLYDQLALGKTPSSALHEAKLTFMRSGATHRKPFFWAPYQTYIR